MSTSKLMWLDNQGVAGLHGHMEQVALDYQQERPNLEVSDLMGLVIRALGALIGEELRGVAWLGGIKTISDIKQLYALFTKIITDAARKIVEEEEMDLDLDYVTARRVGRALGKMRIAKTERSGGKATWLGDNAR